LCADEERGGICIFDRASEAEEFVQSELIGVVDLDLSGVLGVDISLSGERLAVTTCQFDCLAQSVVYLFEKLAGDWQEFLKLAPDQPIDQQIFGDSIALIGDLLFVGPPFDSSFAEYRRVSSYVVDANPVELVGEACLIVKTSSNRVVTFCL
jgi:hypothetical protein